ncbi:tape measure protein [Clostridium sp. AM58-1XD]|uniref:tape measure protein n=1 Tax=Clostridium sp. AM58-1XD TaxID=2292307 RepID=UPI000E4A756A|nr:tape measure protein [Clostridium sp. AM58-1XD]RGY97270.1 hypothetical protein DXA13_15125 [Clostridium sp. AM58-1XD]
MVINNETLSLAANFSSSFQTIVNLGDQAARSIYMLDRNLSRAMGRSAGATIGSIRQLRGDVQETNRLFSQFAESQQRSSAEAQEMSRAISELAENQQRCAGEIQETNRAISELAENQQSCAGVTEGTTRAAGSMMSVFSKIGGMVSKIKLAKPMLELSDTITQTQTRLGSLVGSEEELNAVQQQIYESAQRSRTSYMGLADTVTNLGQSAGNVFSGNEEMIQFAENLNKEFAIAGTSQDDITSATQQLTQALGSGVLSGEDLNSVFAAAPGMVQTIADYLGTDVDKIGEMADEGMLTADIFKNAMLAATDDIDQQFQNTPMTFAQAWGMVENAGVKAFSKVSEKLSEFLNSDSGEAVISGIAGAFEILGSIASTVADILVAGAQLIIENWDYVYPILIGLGAAFAIAGVQALVSGIQALAGWWPVIATILIIVAAVAAVVFVLQQAGVTWQQVGEIVGAVLGGIYSVAYTVVAYIWNLFATFAEFFANIFNDPVAAIAHLFHGLLDNILQVVESAAKAIDMLLHTNMSGAVAGFRKDLEDWVVETAGENEKKIDRMPTTDWEGNISKGAETGGNLGAKMDNLGAENDWFSGAGSSIPGPTSSGGYGAGGYSSGGSVSGIPTPAVPATGGQANIDSVKNVKNVEGDVNLSDEDVKIYRDLSEQRYLNQIELQTLAPQITVTIPESAAKNLTSKDIADKLKVLLIEQMSSHTAAAHG